MRKSDRQLLVGQEVWEASHFDILAALPKCSSIAMCVNCSGLTWRIRGPIGKHYKIQWSFLDNHKPSHHFGHGRITEEVVEGGGGQDTCAFTADAKRTSYNNHCRCKSASASRERYWLREHQTCTTLRSPLHLRLHARRRQFPPPYHPYGFWRYRRETRMPVILQEGTSSGTPTLEKDLDPLVLLLPVFVITLLSTSGIGSCCRVAACCSATLVNTALVCCLTLPFTRRFGTCCSSVRSILP